MEVQVFSAAGVKQCDRIDPRAHSGDPARVATIGTMARVLLCWELGGDYGHLMRFATVARELARRGHESVFALRELTHVEAVLGQESFSCLQAPVWMAQVSGLPPPT